MSSDVKDDCIWNSAVKDLYDQMLAKIPKVLRSTAEKQVLSKIHKRLHQENRNSIEEQDMVHGFFDATPFGFHGPMKTDMESLNIDYQKYGYQ